MKAFLTQIDWIRNTFFFVFYFFMVMLIYSLVVVPFLEDFRQRNAKFRKEEYVLEQMKAQRDLEKRRYLEYKENNQKTLDAYQHILSKEEIKEKLQLIFDIADVVADGAPFMEGNYMKQRYVISGKVKDISYLKDALKLTKTLPAITRFSFPIHIEREEELLVFSFRLDTYFIPKK